MNDTWYQRDVRSAIKGMARLNLEERGAYNTLIDHQYLMGGPLPEDDRHIAGPMGCDVRVWKRVKKQLVAKDRIQISDGLIEDVRASYELAKRDAQRKKRIASGQAGGKASGESRKNKKLGEAPASKQTNQIRREENINTVPNGTGVPPPSFAQFIYQKGRELLAEDERPPKDPGALVSKWLRDHGEPSVLDAFHRCEAKKTPQRIRFIEGCLRQSAAGRKAQSANDRALDRISAEVNRARRAAG